MRTTSVTAAIFMIAIPAAACGGTAVSTTHGTGDGSTGETYSGTYSGAIVGEVELHATGHSPTSILFGQFEPGPPPDPNAGRVPSRWGDLLGWRCQGTDSMTVGSCCEMRVFPPNYGPPGTSPKAGAVAIELGGTLLATLDPVVDESSPSVQQVPVSFGSGDALAVKGSGRGPVAHFAGTLDVPAPLTGSDPLLGSGPITVERSKPFQFSWTPEGKDGEAMELSFDSGDYVVDCHVLDAAGAVVVDASLLAVLPAGAASVSARRVIARTTSGANVKVALIGWMVTDGVATLK